MMAAFGMNEEEFWEAVEAFCKGESLGSGSRQRLVFTGVFPEKEDAAED